MWLPGYLDQDDDPGYKLTEKTRPGLEESVIKMASTRFPVRPFEGSSAAPVNSGPVRQAIPGSEPQPVSTTSPERPDLPVREPDAGQQQPARVTKRAWVVQRASVFQAPQTTSAVVGTVEVGTRVRWVASAGGGWEELVMRDGRSVYMQSSAISFISPTQQSGKFQPNRNSQEVDVSALPVAVERFLGSLSSGDVLRASTHLSPTAPALQDDSLGALTRLVNSQTQPRLDRIEPGRSPADRVVIVIDTADPSIRVRTTWQWSTRQARWLLMEWR